MLLMTAQHLPQNYSLLDPLITPSKISRICLHPSIPTASIVSTYVQCTFESMFSIVTFISSSSSIAFSPTGTDVVVPTVKNGSSCSSGSDRSSSGSRKSLRGSRGVDALPLIPAVQPQRRPGIGIPASTSASVQALIAAARSDPSADRTETWMLIVLCGYR